MRRMVSVCSVAIAIVTHCSAIADAQTVAVGPYYATPSWDQTFACTTTSSCPRFVVLANFSNEAVLDRETGLIWQQNPSSFPATWADAQDSVGSNGCLMAGDGGRVGWRLPTIDELQSLFLPSSGGLPPGHPFGPNANGNFWSSSTSAFDSTKAMVWGSNTFGNADKTETFSFWCVRGPAH